jgi:hypothetical protein
MDNAVVLKLQITVVLIVGSLLVTLEKYYVVEIDVSQNQALTLTQIIVVDVDTFVQVGLIVVVEFVVVLHAVTAFATTKKHLQIVQQIAKLVVNVAVLLAGSQEMQIQIL